MTIIFDGALKKLQRKRAGSKIENSLLFKETEKRLLERIENFKPQTVMVLGTGFNQHYKDHIKSEELELLPFKAKSFDAVLSNLLLHWVNDLPGVLIQIRNILKENGIFIATILGGNTLTELKQSFYEVEMEMLGGTGARFSPSIDIRDAGMLLSRAGFKMPVADSERITILYDHVVDIMHDLRGMGETNALIERSRKPLTREFIERVNDYYLKNFGTKDGLPVTYDIITLTGLKI